MQQWLKIILQITLLWVIFMVGNTAVSYLHIPLPGNVLGMLLLFALLLLGVIPLKWLEDGASLLLKHMAFFFIPIAVGLMAWGQLFITQGIPLILVIMGTALVTILFTAYTSLLLSPKPISKERE